MRRDPSSPRRNLAKLRRFLAAVTPRSRLPARLALAAAILASAAATDAQAQYSRPAQQVLARAFSASGGQGWYMLRGWRETGRQGGLAYETWIDPLRYGLRTETRDAHGLRIQGFNGQADWQVGVGGTITAVNDHATLSRVRTEAFFAANCYFFRGRFDARGDYLGSRSLDGRSYEVVRIQPWGGEARELWFDRKSGLLARIVDRTARRASAVRVSDYRKVGPVLIPFRLVAEPGARASDPLPRERDAVSFAPIPRERFSLNRPEELAKVEAGRGDDRAAPAPPTPAAARP